MFQAIGDTRGERRPILRRREGLYLGPAALIERHGDGYRVRPAAEIAALLSPPPLRTLLMSSAASRGSNASPAFYRTGTSHSPK